MIENRGRGKAFPWKTAVRIAVQEARSAWGRFAFVVLAVVMGVGALTGVRSFSQAFRGMLLSQARTLLAGDIAVRAPGGPATAAEQAALAALERQGVRSTRIVESVSMVSAGTAASPILTSLKAVDPRQYPFDGVVATTPSGMLARLDDNDVLASPDLLLRANLHPGDPLAVAGQQFRVLGVLDAEPDRLEGGLAVGPRLLLTPGGLQRTGIVQFGSQVQTRWVFQLTAKAPPLEAVERQIAAAFPGARVLDYRNANPTVERGLEHSTTFLSLISLMALIVGGLGVASAMHAHLQLRLDAIATMKVLGARTSQIARIYGVQTFLLGAAGGILGIGVGALAERVFPRLLQRFFPALPPLGWSWGPAAEGLGAGILITLLMTLPTLVGVRRIRPASLLRRYMEQNRVGWRERRAEMLAAAAPLGGVAALAVALTDQPWRQALRLAAYFLLGLAVGIAVLGAVVWLLLRLLRAAVRWGSRQGRMPTALRHGCANLYRPGSQTFPVLLALGLGVMFTLNVFLLQRALLGDLQRDTPPGEANVFLIDIPAAQAGAVMALVERQPGLERPPELVRTVTARLAGGRGRRDFGVMTAATLPAGVEVMAGRWWTGEPGLPQSAVSEETARALRLHLGQALVWTADGASFTAPLMAIYRADPQRLIARVSAMVSPGPLDHATASVNGGVRVAPDQIPSFERALYAGFPTVTVVNLADVIERVQTVVDQITLVVHFVSFFAVLAGAIILASSVAGTRFRRMREIAVLKTFGGSRGRIAAIFSTEFLLLGATAGAAGTLLAIGFTYLITARVLHLPFHLDAGACLLAVAATAAIAVGAGWLASARLLGLKPLAVLRAEQ